MNKKGFTLVELLAIIVVIALISVLISPSIINLFGTSKDKTYEILINNIQKAAENYFQECEYGDLSSARYGTKACRIDKINDNKSKTEISLETLATFGMLKVTSVDEEQNKVIINPKNNENINSCRIRITKELIKNNQSIKKVQYTVESISSDTKCPSTYQ